jgi:hypothetical protein
MITQSEHPLKQLNLTEMKTLPWVALKAHLFTTRRDPCPRLVMMSTSRTPTSTLSSLTWITKWPTTCQWCSRQATQVINNSNKLLCMELIDFIRTLTTLNTVDSSQVIKSTTSKQLLSGLQTISRGKLMATRLLERDFNNKIKSTFNNNNKEGCKWLALLDLHLTLSELTQLPFRQGICTTLVLGLTWVPLPNNS